MRIAPSKIAVPVPLVQQCDDRSCGPACLTSILAYYHVPFQNLARVRKVLKTSEFGTTPLRLKLAAVASGLPWESHLGMEFDELDDALERGQPTICLIQAHGDGHYVVVVGSDSRYIYLMDPMIEGHYGYMSRAMFKDRWFDESGGATFHRFGLTIWRTRHPDRLIVKEVT